MRTSSRRIGLVWLALAAFFSALPLAAQTQDLQGDVVRELHPAPIPSPFPLDEHGRGAAALEFRTPEQMTAADRELAEANQAEIARRASLQGFGPVSARAGAEEEIAGKGSWGYEQAVCPAIPNSLILEYSRVEIPDSVTLFSVAIPRSTANGGHVRLIPVRRRGYSLWTQAPSNALTLNDFNHMVAESGKGVDPDWLTLGLCYAALAGGHVRAALLPASAAAEVYPLSPPAKLAVSRRGGAEVRFADVSQASEPKPVAMDWILDFAQDGHLLKVRHQASVEVGERPLPKVSPEAAKPVPGAPMAISQPSK